MPRPPGTCAAGASFGGVANSFGGAVDADLSMRFLCFLKSRLREHGIEDEDFDGEELDGQVGEGVPGEDRNQMEDATSPYQRDQVMLSEDEFISADED